MGEQTDKRLAVTLHLSPRAQEVVREVKDDTNTTVVGFLEQLVEFYAALPRRVQSEIRDKKGDPVGELVRIRMAEMAAAGKGNLTVALDSNAAIEILRLATDRLEQIELARARDKQVDKRGRK